MANAHVFWDNSNIWIEGMKTCKRIEPKIDCHMFRLNVKNIISFIRRSDKLMTRVVAGSIPPDTKDIWTKFEDYGFETRLLRKVQGNILKKKREQYVDEALFLPMYHLLTVSKKPHTLILLSGDGATSESGYSFTEIMKVALDKRWKVRCYSWRQSTSSKIKTLLKENSCGEWIPLDDYYYNITFIKNGRDAIGFRS